MNVLAREQQAERDLVAAAEVVDRGWCQGTLAKDRHGAGVMSCDPDAVAWCANGAVYRAVEGPAGIVLMSNEALARADAALELLAQRVDFVGQHSLDPLDPATVVARWNDAAGRTAAEVAAMLRDRL